MTQSTYTKQCTPFPVTCPPKCPLATPLQTRLAGKHPILIRITVCCSLIFYHIILIVIAVLLFLIEEDPTEPFSEAQSRALKRLKVEGLYYSDEQNSAVVFRTLSSVLMGLLTETEGKDPPPNARNDRNGSSDAAQEAVTTGAVCGGGGGAGVRAIAFEELKSATGALVTGTAQALSNEHSLSVSVHSLVPLVGPCVRRLFKMGWIYRPHEHSDSFARLSFRFFGHCLLQIVQSFSQNPLNSPLGPFYFVLFCMTLMNFFSLLVVCCRGHFCGRNPTKSEQPKRVLQCSRRTHLTNCFAS